MLHFTETQSWIILLVMAASIILSMWAILVIIPNRNEEILALRERNQTLDYWIGNVTVASGDQPRVILTGSPLQKKMKELQQIHQSLTNQLTRCDKDIRYFSELIDEPRKPTDHA